MLKPIPHRILTGTAICLATGLCSCMQTQEPPPLLCNPIVTYGIQYREQLAEFKHKYPVALADFKKSIIRAYAALPEKGEDQEELPMSLNEKIWKKLANSPSFKLIPETVSLAIGGCPHGVYTALWE